MRISVRSLNSRSSMGSLTKPPNFALISIVAPGSSRSISTNRYGVARVTGLRSDSSFLLFTAEDGKGGHGQHAESFWLRESAVRVYTNTTLYRRGDPLEVEVRSTFANGAVVLEVLREEKVLHSRVLSLRNGKAFTVIP